MRMEHGDVPTEGIYWVSIYKGRVHSSNYKVSRKTKVDS